MSKAFTRETETEPDEEFDEASPLPAGTRNYITPSGFARLKDELSHLVEVERPSVVATVAWAAGNGDRSENGDYIYGKKRLREIDRRIRFLVRRLDRAEVVDPAARRGADATDQVFFGATVRFAAAAGGERTIRIVGVDEIDTARGHVSWVSPLARALIKSREGEVVTVRTPGGVEEVEILEVRYEAIDTRPESAGSGPRPQSAGPAPRGESGGSSLAHADVAGALPSLEPPTVDGRVVRDAPAR